MDIGPVIIWLIIIGLVLYFVNKYVPMQESIKNILNAFVIIVVVIWLATILLGVMPSIRIGK